MPFGIEHVEFKWNECLLMVIKKPTIVLIYTFEKYNRWQAKNSKFAAKTYGIVLLIIAHFAWNWVHKKALEYNVTLLLPGSVHPMLTITHTSYSCHEAVGKKSTDSSPSHSQISRNSSKRSNNSLLVNNGKCEGKYWRSKQHILSIKL